MSIVSSIFGVLAATGVLGFVLWRFARFSERTEHDARLRRRLFLLMVALYASGALLGIVLVITGKEPVQALLGLPLSFVFIWVFWRAATATKVPSVDSPKQNLH